MQCHHSDRYCQRLVRTKGGRCGVGNLLWHVYKLEAPPSPSVLMNVNPPLGPGRTAAFTTSQVHGCMGA